MAHSPQHRFLVSLGFLVLFISLPSSHPLSIHDLLKTRGLPAGLLPKDVKSYTLSEDGLLEVFLEGPCLTKFDTMAFYESVVRANLTYGGLTGVEGFSQEELFLWVPVKDIIVDDPKSGLILFDIGLAHKQLSLSLFEDPPDCKQDEKIRFDESSQNSNSLGNYPWIDDNFQGVFKKITRKEGGFEAQR